MAAAIASHTTADRTSMTLARVTSNARFSAGSTTRTASSVSIRTAVSAAVSSRAGGGKMPIPYSSCLRRRHRAQKLVVLGNDSLARIAALDLRSAALAHAAAKSRRRAQLEDRTRQSSRVLRLDTHSAPGFGHQ